MYTFARRYTFLLYLTHTLTIGIAESQIEYQLTCTGGPVNDTSIVQAAQQARKHKGVNEKHLRYTDCLNI